MRKLKFRYLRIQNFMCFGPEGIEIYFDDHGNVVLILGENRDTGTAENPASNGSGKSSIQDAISFCLYGKTVKKPKKLSHASVINTKSSKKLEVELHIDDLRIIRGCAPNKLEIWKSEDHLWDKTTKISKGKGTQQFIEEQIGLTHAAFCQVLVFDDSDKHSFLEQDTKNKREIVENLLDLEKFADYLENTKKRYKLLKDQIDGLTKDYSRLLSEVDEVEKRHKTIKDQEESWLSSRKEEVESLTKRIKSKQEELGKTDKDNLLATYQQAQDRISKIYEEIPTINQRIDKLNPLILDAQNKLDKAQEEYVQLGSEQQKHLATLNNTKASLVKSEELLNSLKSLEEGQTCSVCKGKIDKKNYSNVLLHEENCSNAMRATIKEEEQKVNLLSQTIKKKQDFINKLRTTISEAQTKLKAFNGNFNKLQQELTTLLKVEKPDVSAKQQVLESQISELIFQRGNKQQELAGDSPYKEILNQNIEEKKKKSLAAEAKSKEIKHLEKEELPYYEYWIKGFGDKGIRRLAVDQIIPSLNTRIAYWLRYLIDGKIELIFDNDLNETIKRNGTEVLYHAMSNGESRRINLAVSQAFSYVMMLNSGSCPSLLFLDEITGGGIDESGVNGIYNTIFELAKERQVFVTTHNRTLIDMMQGCESILLVKENDITKRLR